MNLLNLVEYKLHKTEGIFGILTDNFKIIGNFDLTKQTEL